MKKYLLLTALAALMGFNAMAQDADSVKITTQEPVVGRHLNKVSLDIMGLSYTHEAAIGKHETITATAGIAMGASYSSSLYEGEHWGVALWPQIELGYRNYYNLKKRLEKGRNIDNNSGNYYGISAAAGFGSAMIYTNLNGKSGTSMNLAPYWGIQRSLGGNFSFDMNIGAGVNYFAPWKQWSIQPAVKISFHYNIK